MNDVLMNEKSVPKTVYAIQRVINDMIEGKYGLEYLTITKSLKAYYADPSRIAHKALADRIGERDPGNKPKPNDRLGFVYIDIPAQPGKTILQGDRIETPEYIRNHELKPDYEFYITNQIMKPIIQVLAIVVEQIPGYRKEIGYWKRKASTMRMTTTLTRNAIENKIQTEKEKIVKELVFDKYIKKANRRKTSLLQKLWSKKRN
jgi:DNA polymerase elongation subunit (family B)